MIRRDTLYGWLKTPALLTLLGDPPRATPAGEEASPDTQADKQDRQPYLTWQVVIGLPENYLADAPDIDHDRVQFDVYTPTDAVGWAVVAALREALQPHGHEVSFNLDLRDVETRLYRKSIDFEFWLSRD